MNIVEWIENEFVLSREGDGVVFDKTPYVIETKISDFSIMFGEVIQKALDDGVDPKQAIRDSDPENKIGYNDLL